MTVYELIDIIVKDLNSITVQGSQNMQLLLGSIQNLGAIKHCLEESEKAAAEAAEKKEAAPEA